MSQIKCIGILTSGGDAPGMNAAIRAVTRAAIYNGFEVKGIYRGYKGLITGEISPFKTQNVSNIIQQGGTILKTARCQEFKTPEGRKIAHDTLVKEGIDALVVIGGDGTLTGARIFASEYNYPIVGLPGTIDNDLYGTDTTIGYDTALNTIMEAVDKIRDTATSHERLFFIEVMGRDAGFLALNGAIATGAEAAIIPEISTEVDQLEELIKRGPVVCDFWAGWCGPCRMLAPVLDGVAGELAGRATFVKVDVDANGEAAQRYGVMSIPNVIVFKDGVPVGNNLGYVPAPTLKAFLEKYI